MIQTKHMKIAAGTFLAATFFATFSDAAENPTITYTNAYRETKTEEFTASWGDAYYMLEENALDVTVDSGTTYAQFKNLYANAAYLKNLTLNATGAEDEIRVYSKSTVSGNISLSGSTAFFYESGGTIDSGTRFSLTNSTVEFGTSVAHTWNISATEIASGFALISGTGTVMIRNTTISNVPVTSTLVLNFESYDILDQARTLIFADSGITTSSNNFDSIEITVDGWSTTGYSASLDWDTQSANFGKITITNPNIPEPSAFGLLAGILALAFTVARRRRR